MPRQTVKCRHEVQKAFRNDEHRERCLQIPLTADVTTQLTRPREPATHSLCGGGVRAHAQCCTAAKYIRTHAQMLLTSSSSYAIRTRVYAFHAHTRTQTHTATTNELYASQRSVHARTNIVTYRPPCSYTYAMLYRESASPTTHKRTHAGVACVK